MAGKHYAGEVGTDIVVDCGCDVTGATATKLKVKKPDGTEVEWAAAIEGTNFLKYTCVSGDFNLVGVYYLQSSLVLSGWSGHGETARFVIFDKYK